MDLEYWKLTVKLYSIGKKFQGGPLSPWLNSDYIRLSEVNTTSFTGVSSLLVLQYSSRVREPSGRIVHDRLTSVDKEWQVFYLYYEWTLYRPLWITILDSSRNLGTTTLGPFLVEKGSVIGDSTFVQHFSWKQPTEGLWSPGTSWHVLWRPRLQNWPFLVRN